MNHSASKLELLINEHAGFRSVLESLNQALVMADENGFVRFANGQFVEQTGYTREEVIGKRVYELFYPAGSPEREQAETRMAERYEARKKGFAETYEVHIVRKDGERRWIEIKAGPLFDDGGKIIGSIGSNFDITDRKNLEEQLRWSQKMEAVGRLAGGVAHDFNNLLTVIQGYAADLKNQLKSDPDLARKAGVVVEASEAAAALTQQLLSISRKQIVQMGPVSLNDIVDRSIDVIRGLMEARIVTELELSPDLPLTVADASQIQQVLLNLAVNARDAMPEGGKLTIRTDLVNKAGQPMKSIRKHSENFVRLRVQDTGHGISEEIKAKIFEPFFSTKRAKGRGSGLGLAITFGIVNEHKGEIRLESRPGEGAQFDVLFPIDLENREAKRAEQKDWVPLTGSEIVLLAEDQAGVRILVKETLERFGYKVFDAEDGLAALELAASLPKIDLLVTDLVMPRFSGLQLATELNAARPGIGVIVISGYPDERDVWRKLNDLGSEFLAKPFSPETLARLVRKVLDKKQAAPVS